MSHNHFCTPSFMESILQSVFHEYINANITVVYVKESKLKPEFYLFCIPLTDFISR